VAVIDLDGFKPVNDTYGHAVGDELLVLVAQRSHRSALRNPRPDCPYVGGDEFVGVFPGCGQPRQPGASSASACSGCSITPFMVHGAPAFSLGGSIGLAIAPEDGALTRTACCAAADAAMYRAKQHRQTPRLYLASVVTGGGRVA
jgi:diguanylate cyclase (GGDEF)-like protein